MLSSIILTIPSDNPEASEFRPSWGTADKLLVQNASEAWRFQHLHISPHFDIKYGLLQGQGFRILHAHTCQFSFRGTLALGLTAHMQSSAQFRTELASECRALWHSLVGLKLHCQIRVQSMARASTFTSAADLPCSTSMYQQNRLGVFC